jgi:hypothetical protein
VSELTGILNLFPGITGTSVWVVTALRSSSSVYTFLCIIIFFSLLSLLTAHLRLLSELHLYLVQKQALQIKL